MQSLVKELINESNNSSIPINQLLRKALIISRKIGDEEFTSWIENELNGYTDPKDLPDYRKVSGSLKARNQFHGLVPFDFESTEDAEMFSKKNIFEPIGNIENLFKSSNDNATIESPIPQGIKNSLLKITKGMEPVYILNPTELLGIVEKVRNIIFHWTLNLESEGVLGEDTDFTQVEKEDAKNVTFNISHMINSQIQSDSKDSIQIMLNMDYDLKKVIEFIKELKLSFNELEIGDEEKNELKADIGSIESQISSPKPKHSIIREALKSIKNILEGAAGSMLAYELLKMLLKSLS